MRVLVAGASGSIGAPLISVLVGRGHAVGGLFKNPNNARHVAALGAEPIVADALDLEAVLQAVRGFKPDVIVHQLTALSGDMDLRHFDRYFAATNLLRTKGTDNLLEAARLNGVKKFVAQSFAGWPYMREGSWVKSETDPLDPDPPKAFVRTLCAIKHLETKVLSATDMGGTALRYAGIYGPGTALSKTGAVAKAIERRGFPIVGSGSGVWSFIHVEDAASATAAAINDPEGGLYNTADDEPAPVREWLPKLAHFLDAPQPLRIPLFLAKLLLPAHMIAMMTELRGCSNARIKSRFGWRPRYASWREGFRHGLG